MYLTSVQLQFTNMLDSVIRTCKDFKQAEFVVIKTE